LLTTTGGIADSDPASLIASLLPPGGVQLLVENGSTGATAISGEEVEIGSDGVPVSQERLKKIGDGITADVVIAAGSLEPSVAWGTGWDPGIGVCFPGTVTVDGPPSYAGCGTGTPIAAPPPGACTYTCTGAKTWTRVSYWLNADCTSGPMTLTPMTAPGPFTITKPMTTPGVCP